jgi:hypothetical protein
VTGDFHLVDPGLAMVDRGDAVLDPRRKHEIGDDCLSWLPVLLVRYSAFHVRIEVALSVDSFAG